MNVTADTLEKKFKGEGSHRFAQIAEIGGFGKVGSGEGGLDPETNLDLTGVLDPDNGAVTDGDKNQIRKLAGLEDKAAPKKAEADK